MLQARNTRELITLGTVANLRRMRIGRLMCQLPCPLAGQFWATFYSLSEFPGGSSPHSSLLINPLSASLFSLPYLLGCVLLRSPPRWAYALPTGCVIFALRRNQTKKNLKHWQFLILVALFTPPPPPFLHQIWWLKSWAFALNRLRFKSSFPFGGKWLNLSELQSSVSVKWG